MEYDGIGRRTRGSENESVEANLEDISYCAYDYTMFLRIESLRKRREGNALPFELCFRAWSEKLGVWSNTFLSRGDSFLIVVEALALN